MAHKTVASTSTSSSNSMAASTKFKIEQAVPSNSIKKGPHALERSVDPNEVVIKRRFGEGSRPIFERDGISINRGQPKDLSLYEAEGSPKNKAQRRSRKYSSSSESNSPERFRQPASSNQSRTNFKHTRSNNLQSTKRKTPEKIPYFLDEKREKERLQRHYGSTAGAGLLKSDKHSKKPSLSSHRRRSYSRSCSRSPPKSYKSQMQTVSSASLPKYKHSQTHSSSCSRQRSPRDNERRHHDRTLSSERRTRHRHYSKSRGRSRSRSRDCIRARSSDRYCDHAGSGHEHEASAKPATQIITIPVPIDPYGFPAVGYPTWPHQPGWPAAPQGAPRYAAPYPLPTIMPPYVGAALYPHYRPPPPTYGVPYNARMFRPQRFSARPARGNFRPRNY